MIDFYSPVAEFYDLVTRAQGDADALLRNRLHTQAVTPHPILDIGAGTGRTTRLIAEAVPDVEILAVEPAPAMRAVLMHVVAADPELRRRVTIIPDPVQALALPERLGAVVAFGVLGHLSREDRRALWEALLPRLAPGAPLFVELLPIDKPMPLAGLPLAKETIGQRTYEATLDGKPGEDDIMVLTSTWTVQGGPCPPQKVCNTSVWHTFGLDDLARETGLQTERLGRQSGILHA